MFSLQTPCQHIWECICCCLQIWFYLPSSLESIRTCLSGGFHTLAICLCHGLSFWFSYFMFYLSKFFRHVLLFDSTLCHFTPFVNWSLPFIPVLLLLFLNLFCFPSSVFCSSCACLCSQVLYFISFLSFVDFFHSQICHSLSFCCLLLPAFSWLPFVFAFLYLGFSGCWTSASL